MAGARLVLLRGGVPLQYGYKISFGKSQCRDRIKVRRRLYWSAMSFVVSKLNYEKVL